MASPPRSAALELTPPTSDLLKRHATCHDTDGNAKRQKRTLTQSSRVSQACKSCAYAKLKCEDEKPCKRCQNKGIVCESNSDSRQHNNSSSISSQPPGKEIHEHRMPAAEPLSSCIAHSFGATESSRPRDGCPCFE